MPSKSYYAVIPANVRYCRDLPPNAKLLYGEITALCNERGYCWASNAYFADLYEVAGETISRWVSQLQKEGFIRTEIDADGGNQRRIFITDQEGVLTKRSIGIDEKIKTPLDEKIKHNNTFLNTTPTPSGRSGIPRNKTPVNASLDLELNTWLGAVAAAVGAKDVRTLPKPKQWEKVCIAAIQEQRDLHKMLSVIESEKKRTQGQEEFFSPDTVLQKLQMSGHAKPSKWAHDI